MYKRVRGGSASPAVCALDARGRRMLWCFETGSDVTCSPAVVDGVVRIGSDDG